MASLNRIRIGIILIKMMPLQNDFVQFSQL